MAARKRRVIEWAGGIATLPAPVTGEGTPYHPELLAWISDEQKVLGFEIAKPGEALARAAAHVGETMKQPMFGKAHTPDRIRVATPALAEALRAALPAKIAVVCAPTPELDHVLASMAEHMEQGAEPSYLSPEIGPDAVAAFFRAAARLYRAQPWTIVPSDDTLFAVTIESLGVRDAAMSIIGQAGESFEVVLFSGLDDFEAFIAASEAIAEGREPKLPPHFAVNFERGADLPTSLRKEIAEHRWEVASATAYPWLSVVDADMEPRAPEADELTIAEAIALALPAMLTEERVASTDAWAIGKAVSRTTTVKTHAGPIEVTLRAPYSVGPRPARAPFDVLADLAALTEDGEPLDDEARMELEDELVRRFVESPEARVLSDVQSCHFVMDFAAQYFGATIATLRAPQLREIVFEIIPRKVSIDRSKARWIIDENRAFFAFLKREYGFAHADECLRVLGGDAVQRLEGALANTAGFGMAKSLIMAGRESGFAVDTKDGLEAWMRELQSRPLPPGFPLPSAAPGRAPSPRATHAKKNQRKAARNARRKNRG